ncbi:MAG: carboxypeptidase-like regulatory domain-containing protein [Bacteroidaceae bacterium]|nr:carboxypeptidase-like regulatory domain-containing protein [Bacteroidaceae bacterium]
MQKRARLLTLLGMLGFSVLAMAQTTVKGRLVDAETGEPLMGAYVRLQGEQASAVTNMEGEFTLNNPRKHRQMTASYMGFKTTNFVIGKSGDMGTLQLEPADISLEGVTVTGTIGLDRKTPVALSTISAEEIEEKLGTQEFPEVLKTTPGVHANKQGGGWGDSEIYMRGFANDNIATMVNGVPMNDMENGTVYWSNWAGIGEVTRTLQTQRGLGASKVSAPSVGGTINIITKTLEQKRGGFASYQMGNDGANKISFSVSTGMSKRGWGMTLLGSHNWGDGYVMGTDYKGYTWFASIAKRFNEAHTLSFTGFGTIQEHGQRTSSSNYGPLTIAEWQRVEAEYGVKNYRYNPTFGYYHGEKYNDARNKYHKPQLSLNHDWSINEKSSLSTALYMSIGRGNGTTAEGHGAGTYTDYYGVSNGLVKNTFRTADGFFDYDALYARNAASDEGSVLAMCKSVNNHLWTGLLSTYTNKFGQYVDFYGGLDFRYYKGDHSTEITDLFGGKYFMDDQDRSSVIVNNNANAANPNWIYKKLGVGDKVYRDFSGFVVQEGVFSQAEFNKGPLSSFVSGALNNTTYWRRDRFYYDKAHEKSDNVNFLGGNIKAGANYNLNDYHNIFVNVGYISRAPKFNGAFMQNTTSNVINKDAKNEKILSFELGYGWRCSWAQMKLNGYYTNWMDKTMTKYLTLGNQETGYMNMGGVDARHMGIELEGKIMPARWVDIKGMLSLGDWKWNSIGEGFVYNDHGQAVDADGNRVTAFSQDHAQGRVDLKGVRVGGSAQTTASLGVDFKIGSDIKVGGDWTYYGRNYSYYSLSGSNITVKQNATTGEWTTTTPQDPWQIPCASQIDLHASYKFNVCRDVKAVLSGTVNNLLDYQYIGKAYNSSTSSVAATADNVYVFYNFGRTYSIRLKLNF